MAWAGSLVPRKDYKLPIKCVSIPKLVFGYQPTYATSHYQLKLGLNIFYIVAALMYNFIMKVTFWAPE